MLDDWEIDFSFEIRKTDCTAWTGFICPHGGAWGLMLQNSGLGAKGSGDAAFNGYGGESLGTVFEFGGTSNDIYVYKKNDEEENQVGYSNDASYITSDSGTTSVKVAYNAVARVLSVWANSGTAVDTDVSPKIIAQVDLSTIFTADGYAYVGFGVDIGWNSWSQVTATGLTISEALTDLGQSSIEEEGRILGADGVLVVDAKTSCGVYRFSGGDTWTVVLEEEGGGRVEIGMEGITDLNNGQYRVAYAGLAEGGQYKVLASLGGLGGIGDDETQIGSFRVNIM